MAAMPNWFWWLFGTVDYLVVASVILKYLWNDNNQEQGSFLFWAVWSLLWPLLLLVIGLQLFGELMGN